MRCDTLPRALPREPSHGGAGAGAGADPVPEYLTRKALQRHLGMSERAVDRFLRVHALRCGPAGQVRVELAAYAACLVGLRRRSTRDDAPVPLPAPAASRPLLPPIEYRPGVDVVAILPLGAGETDPRRTRRMMFVLRERGSARPSTLEELDRVAPGLERMTLYTDDFIENLWAWEILDKFLTAIEIALCLDATTRARASAAEQARHVRACLEWCQSTQGTVTGAGLKRLARESAPEQRGALFDALAQSIGDSARHGAHAPLDYALRALLDEAALAKRLNRAPPTLKRWRVRGEGPVFLRIGKLVRYSSIDVDEWLRRPRGH